MTSAASSSDEGGAGGGGDLTLCVAPQLGSYGRGNSHLIGGDWGGRGVLAHTHAVAQTCLQRAPQERRPGLAGGSAHWEASERFSSSFMH